MLKTYFYAFHIKYVFSAIFMLFLDLVRKLWFIGLYLILFRYRRASYKRFWHSESKLTYSLSIVKRIKTIFSSAILKINTHIDLKLHTVYLHNYIFTIKLSRYYNINKIYDIWQIQLEAYWNATLNLHKLYSISNCNCNFGTAVKFISALYSFRYKRLSSRLKVFIWLCVTFYLYFKLNQLELKVWVNFKLDEKFRAQSSTLSMNWCASTW